jgi:hypothetical protein
MHRLAPLVILPLILGVLGGRTRQVAATLTASYPAGWNLVSGPEGSHVNGAAGPLYTLQAPAADYTLLPAGSTLHGCSGYWAYFPNGGDLVAASGVGSCSAQLSQRDWTMIGNPSSSGSASVAGAQVVMTYTNGAYHTVASLAPGQGAWALGAGSTAITVPGYNTPQPPAGLPGNDEFPWHRGITATVFWIGEPADPDNDFITNAISAWDDAWQAHYGGVDDPANRDGYLPASFTPHENPFYLDLPYDDFDDSGIRHPNALSVVYWAASKQWGSEESMLKNRWVRLVKGANVCYAQWEDAGPFLYDDSQYVFGTAAPKNREANGAGLDVSPATRDCLGFVGLDNAENRVDWQFVDDVNVPDGPWKQIVTTSPVYWTGQ